jgi:hypothetical protein
MLCGLFVHIGGVRHKEASYRIRYFRPSDRDMEAFPLSAIHVIPRDKLSRAMPQGPDGHVHLKPLRRKAFRIRYSEHEADQCVIRVRG